MHRIGRHSLQTGPVAHLITYDDPPPHPRRSRTCACLHLTKHDIFGHTLVICPGAGKDDLPSAILDQPPHAPLLQPPIEIPSCSLLSLFSLYIYNSKNVVCEIYMGPRQPNGGGISSSAWRRLHMAIGKEAPLSL